MTKRKVKEPVSELGAKLAQLRQQRGYSMQQLARETGISAAYICRIEAGGRKPSKDLLETLANFLIPDTNQAEKDELLIAAGFAPNNFRNFMGRLDVLAIYQKALAKNPNDFKTFISFVLSLIRSGQHESAADHIKQGIQRFDDMVQLQALMAVLELSKRNFELAIRFQEEAIRYYHLTPDKSSLRLKLTDLLLSLGVMHFEAGHVSAYNRARSQMDGKSAEAEAHGEQAMMQLKSARRVFSEAFELDPSDVYILDELARVHFTIAYIQPPDQAAKSWKASIKAFESVLLSVDKQSLGYHSLLQSTAFLALAYAKAEKFDKSWFTLNIVEACLPNFWLVHYVKACHFGLMIQAASDRKSESAETKQLYENCLESLMKAVAVEDPQNLTVQEAAIEPDLAPVRKRFAKRFESVLQKG